MSEPLHSLAGRRPARRGSLMVEMVVCAILLTAIASVLVPGLHALGGVRKVERFESLATIELNNVATLIGQNTSADDVRLSDSFQQRFANAELTITAVSDDKEQAADADLQPVRITISHPHQPSQPEASRQLTVWLPAGQAVAWQEEDE